jgi:nucleotide-binding universal stress UspA family protein
MPKFERILFPVDFSERSRAVAPFVLSVAQRHQSRVALLHALQPPPPMYTSLNTVYPEVYDFSGLSADLRAEMEKFATAELPKLDVTCAVEFGDPASVITAFTETENVSLIMMATHGHGAFRRALLGSVTAKVLHDAKVPVWTAAHAPEPAHRAHPKPRYILCALDLKPESRHTLEVAIQIASDNGASIELFHVVPEGEIESIRAETRIHDLLVEAARSRLVKIQEEADATDIQTVLAGGSVADMLRDVAIRKRADLVVIGRGCIQKGFNGRLRANAYAILREAPCPVLSV